MTISKLPPFLCALAVGASCFTAQAGDNPAQAAARTALAKQLFESNGSADTSVPAGQAPVITVTTNWSSPGTPPAPALDAHARHEAAKQAKAAAEAQAKADKVAADAQAKQAAADWKAKQAADRKLAEEQAAQAEAQAHAEKAAAAAQAKQQAEVKRAEQKAAQAQAEQAAADAQAKQAAQAKLAEQQAAQAKIEPAPVAVKPVQTGDNAAQAAARAALAQQLFEPDHAAPATAVSGTESAEAAAQAQAQPVTQPVQMGDNAQQAAARNALAMQKFDQNGQPVVSEPPARHSHHASAKTAKAHGKAHGKAHAKAHAKEAKAKHVAAQPAVAQVKSEENALPEEPQAEVDPALARAQAKAKADKDAALAAGGLPPVAAPPTAILAPTAPASVAPTPVVAAPVAKPLPTVPVNPDYVGKDLGMKRINAPALPISAAKEEQLQVLLGKYQADQVTPEEYHRQRAAILAQP